jgi:hypothetical protein
LPITRGSIPHGLYEVKHKSIKGWWVLQKRSTIVLLFIFFICFACFVPSTGFNDFNKLSDTANIKNPRTQHGVQGVGGSNPLVPTNDINRLAEMLTYFF